MENFAAIAMVETLKDAMADILVRRITQHQPRGFIFHTRSARLPAFKISLDGRQPAFYPSEAKLPIETIPTDFLMTLRKHLTSAEVTSFKKPLSDRVIEMGFKTVVPSKALERVTLVIELIPNAPNLILLDAERRVLASFLPLSPQHGIAEHEAYAPPPLRDKIDLDSLLQEDSAVDLSGCAAAPDPASWLVSNVAGLGPAFAKEIVHRQRRSQKPVTEEIRTLVDQALSGHGACLYTGLPLSHILDQNDLERLRRAVLSPVALESADRGLSLRDFPGIAEAARFYFDELETRTALEREKAPAIHDLRARIKRLNEREKKLALDQNRLDEGEMLQRNAQALVTAGMGMDRRYDSATVTDYADGEPKSVTIALDPALTLRENIDRMFKRSGKADRGKPAIAKQIAELKDRRAALNEQMRRMQAIGDWDTWLGVTAQLGRESRGAGKDAAAAAVRAHSPLKRFRTTTFDGYEILVGRNSRENDELTFQVAAPDDFWFHVVDYTGSHVLVRNPQRRRDLEEGPLVKAAQLAAFFSQARNTSKVEVHYTRRKHVTKPKRARPGMVKLTEFSTIEVEPKNWFE